MRRFVILSLLALTLVVPPAPSWADDDAPPVELPAIDGPDQWHLMTHDDATSTSKCVGDPKTPLCAIETVLACYLRSKVELCRIGTGDKNFPALPNTKIQPSESRRYWVAGVEIVTEKNKAAYRKVVYLRPQVGDVAIKIHDVDCYFGKCPKPVGPPAIYLVRRNGDKWMVTDKAVPRW